MASISLSVTVQWPSHAHLNDHYVQCPILSGHTIEYRLPQEVLQFARRYMSDTDRPRTLSGCL